MIWIIVLSILLLISSSINATLVWYCGKIGPIFAAAENIEKFFVELVHFKDHLVYILSLEFYQGEQRIQTLLRHTHALIQLIKKYEGVYSLTNPNLLNLIQEEIDYEEEEKRTSREQDTN